MPWPETVVWPEVVTGFFDPEVEALLQAGNPIPMPITKAERDKEKEENGDDDEEESTPDTGPDPVQCAEQFAKLQALYDEAWEALSKNGSADKATQEKRNAVAEHILFFKLSPKIVDEVSTNLRNRINQIRVIEKQIMKICVSDAGMPRDEFLRSYREGKLTDPEWLEKCIRAKRKYSSELNSRKDEIIEMQTALRASESDNLLSLDEIKDINRRMNVGDAKARRAKKEMVEANLRLVISIAKKVHQPRPAVPGPDPGRQHRPDEGGGQVRIPPRLQVFHLCHLVDSPGHHPLHCGSGAHHPYSGAHDRDHQQAQPHLAPDAAGNGPRAHAGRAGDEDGNAGRQDSQGAEDRQGADLHGNPDWRRRRFAPGRLHRRPGTIAISPVESATTQSPGPEATHQDPRQPHRRAKPRCCACVSAST